MRRRTKSEIQVAPSPDPTPKYLLLIPVYKNTPYNYIYDATSDGSVYDRNNYCIIPYKVPPMMFDGTVYDIDLKAVQSIVPPISTMRDLNYDHDIWDSAGISFSSVVLSVFLGFVDIINSSMCMCEGGESCIHITGYPDYKNHPEKYQCGPLDKLDLGYMGISDAFANAWADAWDVSLINRPIKYGSSKRSKKDESSSSSSSTVGPGGAAWLCKIETPPSGNGGTAVVSGISVDGSGAVKTSGSMVVNVPAI